MTEYLYPVDIGNRALQHLGAQRMSALTDDTKNAAAVNFVYDKVRRAELRRSTWTFATRRAILRAITTTTLQIVPPAWSATRNYQPGEIVSYIGINWQTTTPWNFNNTPGSATDTTWFPYFGPLTIDAYSSGTTYYSGELVYVTNGVAPIVSMYVALTDNSDTPDTIGAYSASVTYARGDVVSYSGSTYTSLIDLNLAHTPPGGAFTLWSSATTYALNDQVITRDGRFYTSNGNSNLAHEPSLTSTYWTVATSPPYVQPWYLTNTGAGARTWRYLGDGVSIEMKGLGLIYPAAMGPSAREGLRNVYKLPSGFLRLAPQDPKAGSTSYLGAPTGLAYNDWVIENGYLISGDIGPIMLRYVADVTDVRGFDDLFCEALAARIALETCEEITQKDGLYRTVAGQYGKFMYEARMVSAIEGGAIEPAEDDYISARA